MNAFTGRKLGVEFRYPTKKTQANQTSVRVFCLQASACSLLVAMLSGCDEPTARLGKLEKILVGLFA